MDSNIIVIGNADPICLTSSLIKFGYAELVSVGPLEMEIEEEVLCENNVVLICSGYTY